MRKENAPRSRRLRMTAQRRVILEELRQVDSHPGAEEVFTMVRRRLPRISLATVYRNLDVLAAAGAIARIDTGSSLKRFDGNAERHYHIRCIRCDRLVDAMVEVQKDFEAHVQSKTDFRILGHTLELTGICPRCEEQAAERA
jgi:Fur family ferric uptake transcriptional regulator